MGLLDVLDGAKQAMSGVLAQKYVRVDLGARALSLSDEFLVKAVERLAQERAPASRVRLVAEPQGFGVTAVAGDAEVQAVLELRGLAYAAGELELTLATHRAPRFEKRPFVNVVVAALIKVAGGTKVASKIFSGVLPPSVQWDGRTATIKTKLDALEGVRLDASATRADGWTRLVLSSAEGLAALQSVLVQGALSSLGLGQSKPTGA